MAKFRLEILAELARQLDFTPLETRAAQLDSAELLLHDLDPQKAYPIDFVVFRITGYQPKSVEAGKPNGVELLTGLALQHDIGLLIEQVSDGLNLRADQSSQPVLAIDDVTERFDVTTKTIQRWRRRGLPARRFTFADGKRRVGFFLSSVERFIAAHRNQLGSTTLCSALEDDEQSKILEHARRLVHRCGCTEQDLSLRIGKRFHRTPMTVLHTLRKHDAEHPQQAILVHAAPPVTEEQAARMVSGRKRGHSLKSLSRKFKRPRATIYRALVLDRVARLNKRKIRFIDDPLYHEAGAGQAIADILSQQELGSTHPRSPAAMGGSDSRVAESRMAKDLPPYLRDLYRTPLLTPLKERALFLKFNFHKFQFVTARRKLEPEFAGAADLSVLEQHLRDITAVKNQILQANLRLVVSVARRHVRPGSSNTGGVCLMELISEGNLVLMRAIEGFDLHKGNRFSTYATLALMKGFAQAVPAMLASHRGSTDVEVLSTFADTRSDDAIDQRLNRDHVQTLLGRLSERERLVLQAHYGLGTDTSATYEQVGQRLGLTKQRVRQIEQTALAKLRG